jgi:hypothetical protein
MLCFAFVWGATLGVQTNPVHFVGAAQVSGPYANNAAQSFRRLYVKS